MVNNGPRNGNASRLCQLLEPCRNVDAIAVAVFVLDDDVTEIDANAHVNLLARRHTTIPFGHNALKADRALHRIDDAAEFGQQAIAHQLENAAVMLGNLRLEQLLPMSAKALKRPRLVLLHEPAVAHDVGGQNGRKFSFQAQPSWSEYRSGTDYDAIIHS